MVDRIQQLADAYGIAPGYVSETGDWVTTPPETKAKVLEALGVAIDGGEDDAAMAPPSALRSEDAVSLPRGAFWPQFLVDQRAWGLAVQTYALRSARNWGVGDFEDLARLAEIAAAFGADFIGVSPLHALFLADPSRISPYSPSSRVFLNPLYIAPDLVKGFDRLPERDALMSELQALREAELVNYPAVQRVKLGALDALFDRFVKTEDAPAKEAFARFRREQGPPLKTHALYEALSEHFVAQGGSVSWETWPAQYCDPKSLAARDFARATKRRVDFHTWLQWIADTQLAEAQRRARAAGMRIGLYLDLAVGISPDGSQSWSGGSAVARHARIGCPPDPFSAQGQDWGLVPFSPVGLAAERYEPFRSLLRTNMRHAGALRIDHAMGLQRLYWIPEGSTATDGAYLRYPFRELLEGVAEESWIYRTIVIGEDLGTVPPGFTDTIVRAGLLSYQVLYFTARDSTLMPPEAYRREALVCASTHDLPTLKGWWLGSDIGWRLKAGRATEADASRQRKDRLKDRQRLIQALTEARLLELEASHRQPEERAKRSPKDAPPSNEDMPDAVLVAAHRFLARTPCRLFAVQLDDTLGTVEQANLPGTTDEHPNWQRKMAVAIEQLGAHPLFRALTEAIAAERPRA
jgi:4-alpha-glucanotransferase